MKLLGLIVIVSVFETLKQAEFSDFFCIFGIFFALDIHSNRAGRLFQGPSVKIRHDICSKTEAQFDGGSVVEGDAVWR